MSIRFSPATTLNVKSVVSGELYLAGITVSPGAYGLSTIFARRPNTITRYWPATAPSPSSKRTQSIMPRIVNCRSSRITLSEGTRLGELKQHRPTIQRLAVQCDHSLNRIRGLRPCRTAASRQH